MAKKLGAVSSPQKPFKPFFGPHLTRDPVASDH